MKKVAVCGTGKVGRLIVYLLATSGDYEVTAIDIDDRLLAGTRELLKGKGYNTRTLNLDFENSSDVGNALRGHDYVISSAPFFVNRTIARACREEQINYLDLTEDVETSTMIMELAKGASTAFIPQCGLAPGYISIAASNLAKNFEKLDAVRLRVGAIPKYPRNRLKYNLSWSTDGLINEYANPCDAVVNGKAQKVLPLEGLERFSLDGVEYEAFNTSGGLGTLAAAWEGTVSQLDYKSIRYPGHRELIAFLMEDLKLRDDRPLMKRLLENAMPYTFQDVIVIYVSATGWRSDTYMQETFVKKVYHKEIDGVHWGSIQITTAASACAVLDLHNHGVIPAAGFIHQHDIDFRKFSSNRFGSHYA